ncbi:J domain-containing protein [Roseateles saccharophilus]|uniref:DnaJ-like protein n=1 Tax=Roseateles saccharophilus TaxID=304 RepID=A0A4R3U914_ROSSA|nr:hypothetical protein EV671_10574 [Roseateles saccharophilus]
MSRNYVPQISAERAGAALTPPQKRFNTLIRQIEQARQLLGAWHENIASYRLAHTQVVLPLEAELTAVRRQWVFTLDRLLEQRNWTKAERSTLRELACDGASALLTMREDDAELKALFAKHAEVDFDTERREAVRAMKDLAEAMTGLDLGDDDGLHTDDDLFERLQQGMKERAAADEDEAAEDAEEADLNAKAAGRHRSAAQKRREAEAQQASQSMREIFRKLASALHPDRETDEGKRKEKTVLMQRVNQAYAASDLLALLELQLQIEQIDASHIASASAQRLKHYNKVLSEQLAELRAEVDHVEMQFRFEFGLEPGWGLKPGKLGSVLDQHSRELRAELSQQQRDLRMLSDTAATKRWLKRERQLMREEDEFFDFPPF